LHCRIEQWLEMPEAESQTPLVEHRTESIEDSFMHSMAHDRTLSSPAAPLPTPSSAAAGHVAAAKLGVPAARPSGISAALSESKGSAAAAAVTGRRPVGMPISNPVFFSSLFSLKASEC
jgi:hypothetical protein